MAGSSLRCSDAEKIAGVHGDCAITLAIGIGANTIMFSMSDLLLLLHARKVKNPEQLAYCAIQNAELPWFRYSSYLALRDSRLAFSDVLAEDIGEGPDPTLAHGDSARPVATRYVSANYFSVLGAAPVWGRGFLPEEERPGSAPCRGPEPPPLATAGWRSEACRRICEHQRRPLPGRRCGPGGLHRRHALRPRAMGTIGELPSGVPVGPGTAEPGTVALRRGTTQAGLDHAGGPGTTASAGPAVQTGIPQAMDEQFLAYSPPAGPVHDRGRH